MEEIFIPNNVPSSKNGKRWTGKYLIHSKTVMRYIKETKDNYLDNKEKFLTMVKDKELPLRISFKFIRNSRRKFDYINPAQTVQDLMVKYGYIQDDNCDCLIPYFEEYTYNKEKSGVTIKVL